MRDPLHHATVPAQGIDVKIDHVVEAGPIEMLSHPAAGQGHAHAVRNPLPERSGCGFDPGGPPVLRMTRAAAPQLTKPFDGLQRHRQFTESLVIFAHGLHPGEMKQGVQQHRGVADGQDKTVSVGPDRVLRIETEKSLPQAVGHGGQGHGRPGMA